MWAIQSKNERHEGHRHTCRLPRGFPASIRPKRLCVDFGSKGDSAVKKGSVSYQPRQNPTKYETSKGRTLACAKCMQVMGNFQTSDTAFQGNVISDVVRGPDSGPQGHVLLQECSSWDPRSGSQVPANTFVSLAACMSLPCMFSLVLLLNLPNFDRLSADFIFPLLLFIEVHCHTDKWVSLLKSVFH